MKLIRVHIPQKQPEYCCSNFKLHHNNARLHVANEVLQFLATKNIEIVPHPPYSFDLATCDFFLFPTMKKDLERPPFRVAECNNRAVQAILKRLSNNVFQQRETRSKKCIALDGEYLEGDRRVKV